MKGHAYNLCEKCKIFHRTGTMIWEEHKRYYKTIQMKLTKTRP